MTHPAGSPTDTGAAHDATMRALGELSALERTALVLVYWRNLTQTQVAAELRLPVVDVQRAVARGLQQLARQLLDIA